MRKDLDAHLPRQPALTAAPQNQSDVWPSVFRDGPYGLPRPAITSGFHSIVAELLHAGGWSPTELTASLDLARSRNCDDIADLILDYTTQSPADGLSQRTQRCLTAAGIPLDKQVVLHALRTGALTWATPCYGRKPTSTCAPGWTSVNISPSQRMTRATGYPSPKTVFSTGPTAFFDGPALHPRSQPSGRPSRPVRSSRESVPTTTASKRMPISAAGSVLTQNHCAARYIF